MAALIAGLALFLGIHLVPTAPALRVRWATALGEDRYRLVFSLTAGLGLALIVIGYIVAPRGPQLFTPSPAARAAAPLVMLVSFVLLAAANMRTHIRARLRHPMLIGLILWSLVHLLANGHLKAVILFASFLAYAVVDLASAVNRRAVKRFEPEARYDAMAVAGGVVVALVTMGLHRLLFGVPAVPWSL